MLTATTPTEAALDIEALKKAFEDFDLATLLPNLDSIFGKITLICRICVLVGPILLLVLGLSYLFLAPKEANYYLGYRCYYGMGSVHAWRFTQRIAGMVLGGLGLVLTVVMDRPFPGLRLHGHQCHGLADGVVPGLGGCAEFAGHSGHQRPCHVLV